MEHIRPLLVEFVSARDEGVSVGCVWASCRRGSKLGGVGGRVERRVWIRSEVGQLGWSSRQGSEGEVVGGGGLDESGWGHIEAEEGRRDSEVV